MLAEDTDRLGEPGLTNSVSEFFASAGGLWTSAIGSGLCGLALSTPVERQVLRGGQWQTCGESITTPCLSSGAPVRAVNILGLNAVPNEAAALVLSFILAGICYALADMFGSAHRE